MIETVIKAMIKQTVLLILGFIFIHDAASGQTFQKKFSDLFSKNDTLGQLQVLEEWEASDSDDPELFVAYFNYYVKRSRYGVITLGQNPKGEDVLQILDQDTSIKEPLGFIYSDTHFNPDLLSKGFDWINKGIEKHPDRLDMRFGKVYMFGVIEDYESFTKEIIKTIDYSAINNNKWTWTDSEVLDDPRDFMLSAIQDYQNQLYETENDSLLINMKWIAEAVLNHYPDHVESLSNLSVVLMLRGEYDEALVHLLKAEKINPKDQIVLGNIAHAYKIKGDTGNAIKYYQLTIKYGNKQSKEYAKSQIEELEKK